MSRVVFLYFHGSDPLLGQLMGGLGNSLGQPSLGLLNVLGLDGRTATWLDGSPSNDCFPALLDPNIFEAYSVPYPALGFGMKLSIDAGVAKLVTAINRLPSGQKYAIGGFSQGAAVAGVAYTKIKSGELGAKANNDFLGGVCFGNPIRQTNYRGEVGGTWSGSWDTKNSGTGGHGCFPADAPIPRLSGCEPDRWIEFAEYDDVITSTGDSSFGQNWTAGVAAVVNSFSPSAGLGVSAVLNALNPANWPGIIEGLNTAGKALTFTDATGRVFPFPGNGHVAYPWRPPPGNPDGNLTSYQIAIKWLTSKALQYATAPILMQSSPSGSSASTAGWTTSLTAP